jgi:hypothetical protein
MVSGDEAADPEEGNKAVRCNTDGQDSRHVREL